jgi:hypothetical protein
MQDLHPTKLTLGILTPVFAAAAGWCSAAAAKYGIHLDPTMVGVVFASTATGAIAVGVKLIHDVESDVDHRDPALVADVAAGVTAARASEPAIASAWPSSSAPAR